jgi:hypothetical protein
MVGKAHSLLSLDHVLDAPNRVILSTSEGGIKAAQSLKEKSSPCSLISHDTWIKDFEYIDSLFSHILFADAPHNQERLIILENFVQGMTQIKDQKKYNNLINELLVRFHTLQEKNPQITIVATINENETDKIPLAIGLLLPQIIKE